MKEEIKNLAQFEKLSENTDGFLVSGFSIALSSGEMLIGGNANDVTNNCNGGNCAAHCGT